MRTMLPLDPRELSQLACPWCGRTASRATDGYQVVRAGRVIGAAAVAPPSRGSDLCPPRSAVLTQLWVHPDDLGEHVGTQLVQRVCGHLHARNSRYLVAYGTTHQPDCSHLPGGWLAHTGFTEHVSGVQWRIDLNRTVPGIGLVRDAASGLMRGLRAGADKPAPASRS